jgi:hypothetical protein
MWFRSGDLNGFWEIWALSVSREQNHPIMSWSTCLYTIRCSLTHKHTQNKNIHVYGLGVGISTVVKIFGLVGWHLRKPSVRFSLTLISSLAEFTYFLRLQIVVLWVLQAPIRSRLTDMFILSIVGLNGKLSLSLVPWYFA